MLGEGVRVRAVRGGAQVVGLEVLGVAGEVDGEGADGAVAGLLEPLGGEGGDGGGVEAAGEQGAQRDVGDELAGDDVVEQFTHRVDGGVEVVGVLGGLQGPVAVHGELSPAHPHGVAGAYLVHALVDGVAGRLGEGDQLGQALGVDGGAHGGVREDGLGLGAEEDAVGGRVVVERLDAHAVADEQEFFPAGVPEGEGVHAVEALGERLAPFEVGVEHDLGVAAGAEGVAEPFEFGLQLAVVVDLAAVGGGEQGAAVALDEHRLFAALDVDDGEAAVAEGRVGVQPDAGGVRAAAAHRLRHRVERAALGGQVLVVGDPAGDPAHSRGVPFRFGRPGRTGTQLCPRRSRSATTWRLTATTTVRSV